MKFSIITPTYNSEKTIRDTLVSISSQTYKNFEHIVVDGLSDDDTCNIIRNESPESIISSERDEGIYYAMNKGLKRYTGDVISILNSDDVYFENNVLDVVANEFNNSDIDVLYGHILFFDYRDKSRIIRVWRTGPIKTILIWLGWIMPHPAVFVKRKVYEDIGYFDTLYKNSADYDFLLRIMKSKKYKINFCDDFFVKMRNGGTSDLKFFAKIKEWWVLIKIFRKNYKIYPIWFFVTRPLTKIFQFLNFFNY
jgi:glycosyltransferase